MLLVELSWFIVVISLNTKTGDPDSRMSIGEPAPIATISLKLPLFWPSDSEVWFAQAEA